MYVLLLGPYRDNIVSYIKSFGDEVITTENKISSQNADELENVEFIISFGYKYIIPKEVVARFSKKIINLHISMLPWNKGADPNLWSFLEDTPKGVTIHYIDAGLDTGEIIAQKAVHFPILENVTLKNSYEILVKEIETLFFDIWVKLKEGEIISNPQPSGGSFHRLKDKTKFEDLLTFGWETPVLNLIGKAKEN